MGPLRQLGLDLVNRVAGPLHARHPVDVACVILRTIGAADAFPAIPPDVPSWTEGARIVQEGEQLPRVQVGERLDHGFDPKIGQSMLSNSLICC